MKSISTLLMILPILVFSSCNSNLGMGDLSSLTESEVMTEIGTQEMVISAITSYKERLGDPEEDDMVLASMDKAMHNQICQLLKVSPDTENLIPHIEKKTKICNRKLKLLRAEISRRNR